MLSDAQWDELEPLIEEYRPMVAHFDIKGMEPEGELPSMDIRLIMRLDSPNYEVASNAR